MYKGEKNGVDKLAKMAQDGEEIIILRNGQEMTRLVSHGKAVSFLSDSLRGVLKNDYDDKKMNSERMAGYESAD